MVPHLQHGHQTIHQSSALAKQNIPQTTTSRTRAPQAPVEPTVPQNYLA